MKKTLTNNKNKKNIHNADESNIDLIFEILFPLLISNNPNAQLEKENPDPFLFSAQISG